MTVTTATLTLHNHVKVGSETLGAVLDDSDREQEALYVLRSHGYIAVGTWTEDDHYNRHVPVEYHGLEASLGAVMLASERLDLCQKAVSDAQGRLTAVVKATLDAGVSASDIAAELGVSRSRVYQIRDGRR